MSQSMGLTDVLNQIDHQTDDRQLTIKDVVQVLDHRGYGPLLLAPALIAFLPTGGIPGVPTFMGLLIILIATQIVFGRRYPWLPHSLEKRSIKREKFEKAHHKAKPYTQKFDRLLKPRLEKLTSRKAIRAIAGVCIILAALMPPLEIIPFAVIIPAFAILLLAVGISANDGLFILFGLIIATIGIAASIYWLV
ncbi:MAG: exopolysaccharide biosynthesis protein [Alphaproteobacteria bacterium]